MNQLFYYGFPFLIAAGISFVLTPFVLKLALHFQVVDRPSDRKSHEGEFPSMGGLAIFVSFFLTIGFSTLIFYVWNQQPLMPSIKGVYLLLGALPLIVCGIIDDKYHVNYKFKLIVQILSALIMVHFGFVIEGITNPWNSETVLLGYFSVPVTVFWFVFIINAINLIDGVDGLAAGIALIASLTIFVIALYLGNIQGAVISVVLAGSIIGFLRYNFSPASIFMGDTGSLFLGFMLATLSIMSSQKSSTAVAIAIPIAVLGLPILDTLSTVYRRWYNQWVQSKTFYQKMFSWTRVFFADRNHIHHRLLAQGMTKRKAVILLYILSLGFGLIGFILTATRYQYVALILVYMGAIFFIAFRKFPATQMPFSTQKDAAPNEGVKDFILPIPERENRPRVLVFENKDHLTGEGVNWNEFDSYLNISCTRSEDEALKLCSQGTFPIIISDYVLKSETDSLFHQTLKTYSPHSQFLLMAYPDQFKEIAKTMDSSVLDVLTKPINYTHFQVSVQKAIQQLSIHSKKRWNAFIFLAVILTVPLLFFMGIVIGKVYF